MSMHRANKAYANGIPLSWLLVVPFVVQLFSAVVLVSYLSFKNAQSSTNVLATKLSDEVSSKIDQHLGSYLVVPHQLGQVTVDALNSGLLSTKKFERSGRHFWNLVQVHKSISFLGYYLNSGEGVGAQRWPPGGGVNIVQHSLKDGKDYNYSTDSEGNRKTLIDATDYYAPTDNWYRAAVRANRPIWSRIYTAEGFPGYVAASAVYPLRDKNKKIVGVLSIDLLLSEINKFLQGLKISAAGKVFIIERDGMLIGNSGTALTYSVTRGITRRLSAFDSSDSSIEDTARFLKKKFANFKDIQDQQHLEFFRNGTRQLVNVTPWHDRYGLDWLVVVTIPESDFMAQINANTRTTILLCFAALLTVTLLGILTARWITQPILRLNKASQAIASGNLDQKVEIEGIQELQGLSQSFNRMAEQLRGWVSLLESRVTERTSQLAEAKQSAETAKEAAIAANQSKSQFLANMSHELRTPLNAILGFAQIMTRDASLSSEQLENLQIIGRSGEHLLALINDVLDMSKIEAGRIDSRTNDFDLFRLLESIREMLHQQAQAKGLQLIVEPAAALPRCINTDEKKLRQVLLNLLGNAVKFTDSGFVSLQVNLAEPEAEPRNTENPAIQFAIEDSGSGMAPDELETLFEPFVQTESGRKTEQGTGLGLSISRKFVELMGGTIQVTSTLGRGSRFEFTIPVKLSAAVSTAQPQPERRVTGLAKSQPNYRILVVDDRWENRQLLIKLLEPIGFKVKEATNGEEAIACWKAWRPHLIWMDMRMPVLDGFEATRQIKAQFEGKSTIIIALTASALAEDIPVIHTAGCDDYVRKPFLEREIFDKIGQYLNVKYVYKTLTVHPLESPETLTREALAVMPSSWLTLMHHAAAQLDVEKITSLIEQIPAEEIALRRSIQVKVDNFDFDQIVTLTQPTDTVR
jgi:signal transduction histidine kinase/DNA-binding response OmpR family regulator